jgi:hypothetical protein
MNSTSTSPDQCQRTPTLAPGPFDAARSLAERYAGVAGVIRAWSCLLRDAGLSVLAPATDLAGGRLLLIDPDGTLHDGAATVNSRHFFDDAQFSMASCT